jgi:hypothetical protein
MLASGVMTGRTDVVIEQRNVLDPLLPPLKARRPKVTFPYGKYEGKAIDDPDVPIEYLEWWLSERLKWIDPMSEEIARRQHLKIGDMSWAARLIEAGYHCLTQEHTGNPAARDDIDGARSVLAAVLREYFDDNGPRADAFARMVKRAEALVDDPDVTEEDRDWAENVLDQASRRAIEREKRRR